MNTHTQVVSPVPTPSATLAHPTAPLTRWQRLWRCWTILLSLALLPNAVHAQSIVQPTFTAGQVGKIVYTFDQTNVGDRVTIGDFQHGQLYLASGSAGFNVRDSWWTVTNPLSPVLIQSIVGNHDKPHNICFWQTYFTEADNGQQLHVWDFIQRAQTGSGNGQVNSLWDCVQAPYGYTGSHGYTTGSKIEMWNVSNPSNVVAQGSVDTGTTPGFQIGAVHAFGNLLIGSATEAPGVAVYDISDPINPILLDSRVDGTNLNYTSLCYGSRVYNCERADIRVYDFSNPNHIQLVGTVPTGGTPRYIVFKDGKGYCAPGSTNVVVFDATTLSVTQTYSPDGQIMDFVYPLGNMAIVAGGGGGGNSTNGARIMALQQNPDTNGPTVVYGIPTNNAVNVGLKSRVGFSMSDQINVDSLTTNSFIVRQVGTTTPLPGTYSTMMGLINFSPATPLLGGVTYEVILPVGGVKDVVGNSITQQFRSTFTTMLPVVGSDGLSHRWPLDGNAIDTIGGNSGANNGVTFTNGESGQAGVFNGSSYINVSSIDFSNSFTVAGWVWLDPASTNIQTVLANSSGGTANGFRLFVNTYNTSDRAVLFETGSGTNLVAARTGGGVIPTATWTHVAAVIDRLAGKATLYVNGSNLTTSSTILTNFAVNATVNLGQFTNNSFRLIGRLDDVRTYTRQLAASEITDLITVSHRWPLDGDFTDSYGSNDGANSGVTFTNAARVGTQAGVLRGTDSITVGAINLGDTFSLAAWVWVDGTMTNSQVVMANSAGGSSTDGFRLFINTYNTTNGAVILETGNGTNSNSGASTSGQVNVGGWNHVAVTINRPAGTATFYVNGVNVTSDSTIVTNFNNTNTINFGQMVGGGLRLSGRLDDIRIYNKILSASDVTALVTAAGNTLPVITSFTSSASQAVTNTAVTFTLNATDTNNDSLSYSFDFGDGGGAGSYTSSKTATHTYTTAGRYSVFGRVKDLGGIVTTSIVQVVYYPLTTTNGVSSAQIVYDSSRNKVWNVNPDSDTVTRIDATTLAKDFEIAVGTKPRTLALRPGNAEIWVACESSDQIYVLSATNGTVLQTLATPRGSRPMAVAFPPNGNAAYVTYMNSGLLAKWNPSTYTQTSTLNVGPTPRPLAISGDSSRIFVGRFISPVNSVNPGAEVGEVREVSASAFTVTRTFNLAHDTTPDTETSSRGTPNYLVQMAISPDGRRLLVPSKKDDVDRGTYRDGNALEHDRTVRSIYSKLDLVNNVEALSERVDIDNHSLSHGAAYSPVGDLAFIAMQGNNEVLVFNAYTGATVTGFPLGSELAPQDLVMKPDGSRLFVMNFMTRTVSAYDVSAIVNGTSSSATWLTNISAVATEKLSPQVLLGKQVFYNAADTRMSSEGYISCASCHLDGGQDGRVWDFTDRGEGLRNTITLEGHRGAGQGNVHWTANFDEIQDFELDIRNAFGGSGFITNGTPNASLSTPNAGRSTELDAMAAYVASLTRFSKSPYRNADGTLTSDGVAGRQLFAQLNCTSCHAGADFTDSVNSTNAFVLHDVGTIFPGSGKRLNQTLTGFDTPTLRGLWGTASYLHDASATNLIDVITTKNTNNQHGVTSSLTATQQVQLVSFLQQIDDLEIGGEAHLWPLDGNFNDVIGTNNGVNNGVTFVTGKVGQAGSFNGSNNITVGTNVFTTNFTITSWVWVDTTATNIQTIMANSPGGSQADGFRFFVNTYNTSDGALMFETGDGVTGNSAKTSIGRVIVGAWNFVAITVNRSAGLATLFVNGTNYTADNTIATNFNLSATTYIGQMSNGTYRVKGKLDEVAIFNRLLSTNELQILQYGDSAFTNGSVPGGGGAFAMVGSGGTITLKSVGLAVSAPSDTGSSASQLPSPWQGQDVGSVAAAGSATYTNGTFKANGSGADIWGTGDGFFYVQQVASGDCDVRARVVNLANTDSWAKAGVMIRESLAAGSTHAAMALTPGQGAAFVRRITTGGSSAMTDVKGKTAPGWVRIQRTGNVFTASISSNGVNWTVVGKTTITMSKTVYIGLAVSSRADGTINTATFDNVTAVP